MSLFSIDLLAAMVSGISGFKNLKFAKKEEKALLNEVLEEFFFNLDVVRNDYIKNGLELEAIIPLLKISRLEAAEKARKRNRLDFNKIRTGIISRSCFISNHHVKYYSSFDTERLLLKLRDKFIELKKVRKLYYARGKWKQGINPKRRMSNIVDLLELISNHLSEK